MVGPTTGDTRTPGKGALPLCTPLSDAKGAFEARPVRTPGMKQTVQENKIGLNSRLLPYLVASGRSDTTSTGNECLGTWGSRRLPGLKERSERLTDV